MTDPEDARATPDERDRALPLLEQLLAIEAGNLADALAAASDLVAAALAADKVDAFLHEPATASLVAYGTSDTPLGRRQHALGLGRLPLANGGRTAAVFQTGQPFRHGRADADSEELRGVREALGVRSTLAVPLDVGGARRGVLVASAAAPERFAAADLRFLGLVARWVGLLAHRAELAERLAGAAAEAGRRAAAEQVLTVLAHDLKNHLTPLKFRLALLREGAAGAGRADDAAHAAAAEGTLARLARLVEDLLDVGRLEQGLFALDRAPVDLAALARELAATLGGAPAPVVVRGPRALRALADPGRLRQALENLLANALRHAPAGTAVTVGLAPEARADGAWAVVTVADQGPGIPPELAPRLFSRFAPGPGSPGLGLGLYLASRLAAAHGGTLTVESRPGHGARFELALPTGLPPAGAPGTPPGADRRD